jgi:hypothetical protein
MSELSREDLETMVDVLVNVALNCMDCEIVYDILSKNGISDDAMRKIGMDV